MNKEKKNKKSLMFRLFKGTVSVFYRKCEFVGKENIPNMPCVIIGNHSQMYGPLLAEIQFSDDTDIWCAGEMMNKKESIAYAYEDFWSGKSKATKWLYKALSHVVGPFLCFLFKNARCIPVYRDMRAMTTYKQTIRSLEAGKNILIFPEEHVPYNHVVNNYQKRFVELAKLYFRRTGKELSFVPMYYAVKLRKVLFGKPISFDSTKTIEEQMDDIATYLMDKTTELALSLPPHKVVPYENIPKRKYKWSKEKQK